MTRQTKAYISLIFICVVWGTTYLAIRVGVLHYPPFLFAGVRQVVAGLILIPLALIGNRRTDLSMLNLRRQAFMGFLMLTVGNGGVTWAEKYIPSGIAALLCCMMPIFAVLFNLASSKKDHFNATIGTGMLLGICGVGLIFRHNIADLARPEYIGGMVGILLATAGWAYGSTLSKRYGAAENPLFNAGLQLSLGGIFMLLLSPIADDHSAPLVWNNDGMLSLLYLITFGSVLAYAAYMFALRVLPVGVATIYAYVNPLIAVIAGYLFLHEELNIYVGLAFITIVISVFLVNRGYRQQHKEAATKKGTEMADTFPENAPAES
ncbi:drug/metabolite exporter YedA [Nemorincola caseinilytica]|uniref:Drug/metabolite exporter YedA n=1 Tax=Nemorincola caseinilytica TaxID=2054315 RepID=A0ABP8N8C5_9BACT